MSQQNLPKTKFGEIDGKEKCGFWIKNGIDKDCINYAENFGEYLSKDLTTNQIRNVFGEVRRIQMKGKEKFKKADVLLLKPKLSYAKARKAGLKKEALEAADALRVVLSTGVDAIFQEQDNNEFERFENFTNFFEAILAYHKSYGGK